ncbi:MAG: hypothetical protein LBQ35_01070, partial [Spirochaetaceae bacterium]|nr:hypothetical protein [Spirochaetaceae bacterium]
SAPEEYRDLTEAVYLANMFCEYENQTAGFEQFDSAVLEDFNIPTKKHIEALLDRFRTVFRTGG